VQEGLPVVAEAERGLEMRGKFDLILDEGAEFVDPVETSPDSLLRGEDVGRVRGVVVERCEFYSAEAVGVVVDGATAELWELNADAEVMLSVTPSEDFVDVNSVFGTCDVCLSASADKGAADLGGWGIGD
jgi:hypothetical protein